ncbi:Mu transposase C-terminal domain-containing protein [Brevundimonas vitis]|uniref:Mu transposase C-terminal domain-containing protein n=1 Tax=Brevundimonas vitisensis TaxID=2800818 RepID=A0ABX7BQH5_9CAUL|nr:transposase domain-containing protein [Brevundimonas vitisensis]QQQ19705.1 Mu transposase C-terminal domain-containing protein [Brevundimonas vitisensis]
MTVLHTLSIISPTTALPAGGKQWFTAAELADLKLPGLSSAKRKINELAQAERWALRTDATGMPLCRPHRGRGGGVEYHIAVLPPAASTALVRKGLVGDAAQSAAQGEAANDAPVSQLWSWFDQQTEAVKADARAKLAIIDQVEALEAAGLNRSAAIATVAARSKVGASTIWTYFSAIAGAEPHDRLPRLAPQRKGGGETAEVDAGAWAVFLSDYLRKEGPPTLSSVYRRVQSEYCAPRGIVLPHMKTLKRKLEREVPHPVIISSRYGADALRAVIPAQQRTVADLSAMELVNIDGHKWDVFVRWPDGSIGRPMMVGIQDVYSRKILAWRIGETESAVLTRLAFADLFRDFGIPKACLMDNGRAFASKMITGGAKSRFRFKIKPEEPTGLLTSLGIAIHWALPFRGSSKPIERAWRDLCNSVANRPEFAGAYTGNTVLNKPENYGQKAVDLEEFKRVVALGIEAHNAQLGRNTEMGRGQHSFDQVFEASYATASVGKAKPEHLRMALLASDVVRCDRKDGSIKAYQNIYWSPAMSALAGQRVIVRFDPDDLHSEVHVYSLNNAYLASAPLQERTGFLDVAAAGRRARQEGELRRNTKRQTELLGLMQGEKLAALLASDPKGPMPVSPKVVRPVRARGQMAAALKPVTQEAFTPDAVASPETLTAPERWAAAMDRLNPVAPRPPALRLVDE